jgi:flagellar biosynthetic protein FliP
MMQRLLTLSALVAFVALSAHPALAQSISFDAGGGKGGGSETARIIQMLLLITVLSIAPSLLVMVTSFTRIVIVLSFIRSAIGVQNTPPNQVIIALALFLTGFIMTPTLQQSYKDGIKPLMAEEISEEEGVRLAALPFHKFMIEQVRPKDLQLFVDMMPKDSPKIEKAEDTPYQALIPAFMISELKRAFEIGFLIFIPFLIIDMLIASILMAMGMMMLPPVVISLPFKIIFFVLVDGWYMLSGSLVRSFGVE